MLVESFFVLLRTVQYYYSRAWIAVNIVLVHHFWFQNLVLSSEFIWHSR